MFRLALIISLLLSVAACSSPSAPTPTFFVYEAVAVNDDMPVEAVKINRFDLGKVETFEQGGKKFWKLHFTYDVTAAVCVAQVYFGNDAAPANVVAMKLLARGTTSNTVDFTRGYAGTHTVEISCSHTSRGTAYGYDVTESRQLFLR